MTQLPVRSLKAWGALIPVLATVLGASASVAAASPPATPDVQRALDRIVHAGPPGAVLLLRHGDHTRVLTSGVVDRTTKQPIRSSDRFRVASLTKSYVATVVLQLVGEGKLRLDDTVDRWLPGAVPGGEHITIRQLLDHTSGLFDYFEDAQLMAPYRKGELGYRYTPRSLLALGTAHAPLFAPGTEFSYSNTGYIALGLIVEAATGHRLSTELKTRIFGPLRLHATSFGRGRKRAGRSAHGYARLRRHVRDVSALNLSFEWAAGAVVSTAGDVARYYRALLSGRLVRPDLLRGMTTPGLGAQTGYGFGLEKVASPCGAVYGHGGGTPGFATRAFSSADASRQIVVLYTSDYDSFSPKLQQADSKLLVSAYCGMR